MIVCMCMNTHAQTYSLSEWGAAWSWCAWGAAACIPALACNRCGETHIKQRTGGCVPLCETQLNFRASTAAEKAARVCLAQLWAASFIKQLYFFWI